MKCHHCQYEITGQVKFCPECGAQICTEHRDTFSDNILTVKERLAEHRLDSVRAVIDALRLLWIEVPVDQHDTEGTRRIEHMMSELKALEEIWQVADAEYRAILLKAHDKLHSGDYDDCLILCAEARKINTEGKDVDEIESAAREGREQISKHSHSRAKENRGPRENLTVKPKVTAVYQKRWIPQSQSLVRCAGVIIILTAVFLIGVGVWWFSRSEARTNEKELADNLHLAAERGDADAQFNLGMRYTEGKDIAKDEQEAVKWFRRSAEQGNVDAQNKLSECYMFGQGVPRNMDEGYKWLYKAAEQNHAKSQYNLGTFLLYSGNPEGIPEGIKWLLLAAEQGYADAQKQLGTCYFLGLNVSRDLDEGLKWLRKAAHQGHVEAQYYLGLSLASYDEITKNEEAIKWLKIAAEQGHAEAQRSIGHFYFNDNKIEEAVKWFRKAADQGDMEAQYYLGFFLLYHDDAPKDKSEEAIMLLHKSAKQGYVDAQYQLGQCYLNNIGVPQSVPEAIKWLRLAADQEHIEAQYYIGLCLLYSEHIQKNEEAALKWLRKAAEGGHQEAKECVATYDQTKSMNSSQKSICNFWDFLAEIKPIFDKSLKNSENRTTDAFFDAYGSSAREYAFKMRAYIARSNVPEDFNNAVLKHATAWERISTICHRRPDIPNILLEGAMKATISGLKEGSLEGFLGGLVDEALGGLQGVDKFQLELRQAHEELDSTVSLVYNIAAKYGAF